MVHKWSSEIQKAPFWVGGRLFRNHHVSYSGLGAAHDAVRQWCKANNHNLAGPNWEIYGHWQPEWNTNPSQIRTDIYYLLAR
jgi:effector-binding domain-containing protein